MQKRWCLILNTKESHISDVLSAPLWKIFTIKEGAFPPLEWCLFYQVEFLAVCSITEEGGRQIHVPGDLLPYSLTELTFNVARPGPMDNKLLSIVIPAGCHFTKLYQ